MTQGADKRDFLDLADYDAAALRHIVESSGRVKRGDADMSDALKGKTVLMMFEKPSTRTRVSLETAVKQMGAVILYQYFVIIIIIRFFSL